jgi:hypothetical protein
MTALNTLKAHQHGDDPYEAPGVDSMYGFAGGGGELLDAMPEGDADHVLGPSALDEVERLSQHLFSGNNFL